MPLRLRRALRHCQVALTTVAVLAAAALLVGLWWINRTGFSGEWGTKIEDELAQRGVHAEFRSVRFSPWRGLLARDVKVFSDATRDQVVAEIPFLQIDVDRAEALRGALTLRQLRLEEAEIKLPVTIPGPVPRDLTLRKLSADVVLNREGRLTLTGGTGNIDGIEFALDLSLAGFDPARFLGRPGEPPATGSQGEFFQALLHELARWRFPESTPPRLELSIAGDLGDPSRIRTTLALRANQLSRNDYTAESFYLSGELHQDRLVIDHFEFGDGAGELSGKTEYLISEKSGRFEISSGIHLSRLLRTCFDVDALDDVVSARAPRISATGRFAFTGDEAELDLSATGRLDMPAFRALGHQFTSLATEFSWHNGDVFLRDLEVRDSRGALSGDVRIKGDEIRYQVVSSLFPDAFDSLIKDDSGLEKIIARATFNPRSRLEITATGQIQRSNPRNWSSHGKADLRDLAYNGVPLASVTADYHIDSKASSYENITAVFDYRDYELSERHGGTVEGTVTANRIGYDRTTRLTTIENLQGTAWPAPVLRLFAPRTAAYVERTYGTRRPPTFTARGTVAQLAPFKETDVRIDLRIPGVTDYKFLGEPLALTDSSLKLRVLNRRVEVSDLAFKTFSGTGGGKITVLTPAGRPPRFDGEIRWTRLHFAEIGRTYGFDKASQGLMTGFFKFSGTADSVRTLNGQGAIGLENGHLFYVPVLGPLSSILGEVLGDKRTSHEEARDASCTFAIVDGVFLTSDFLTSTPSSVFTGEGNIDLHRSEIDMTIRMNARGLLGLITLPLRPLTGLFQFRGTGPLKNPTWRNSNFTTPTRGKDDPIFRKPGRAQVVEE